MGPKVNTTAVKSPIIQVIYRKSSSMTTKPMYFYFRFEISRQLISKRSSNTAFSAYAWRNTLKIQAHAFQVAIILYPLQLVVLYTLHCNNISSVRSGKVRTLYTMHLHAATDRADRDLVHVVADGGVIFRRHTTTHLGSVVNYTEQVTYNCLHTCRPIYDLYTEVSKAERTAL